MIPKHLLKAALFSLLSLPALARAHYLWIESATATEARVYFGEFNEGVREKAGGRLDERAALELWLERPGQPKQPLSVSKRADHFSTPLADAAGWLLAADLTSEVKDYRKSDLGIVKPMFYARAAVANRPSAARPVLELDLIPAPGQAGTVQVFFQGKPLAGAKVFVYAPNLWMQELKSDEQGKLTPVTPWPGRYVLDVTHKQASPGEFRGQRYEAVRHRMTFSFVH
jgi:hypothetical protein